MTSEGETRDYRGLPPEEALAYLVEREQKRLEEEAVQRGLSAHRMLWKLAPPEALEAAAEQLDRGSTEFSDAADYLRRLAATTRMYLSWIEKSGGKWDWPTRQLFTKDGRPGSPTGSYSVWVAVAFEALGGRDLDEWYSEETTTKINESLSGLLPPDELTHKKTKERVQRHVKRTQRR